jgi:glycosyltransferase involved in cell wall biosynthesis
MNTPEISVIIAFYDKIDFLKLVIAGFEIQTFKSFEILIADDGSSQEVCNVLSELIKNSVLDIIHIRHEKRGWRKNRILNKAIIASRGNYLIFTDGDCIPHSRFVEEHNMNRGEGIVLSGRRAFLSERISGRLNKTNIAKKYLQGRYLLPLFLHKAFMNDGKFFEDAIYIRNKLIRKLINRKEKGLLGSNFSLYKEDILKVNGFDEQYEEPSVGEDTDLCYRLKLAGINVKTLKHIAIQYHLYHKQLSRDNINRKILKDTISKGKYFAEKGISGHKK